jgi:hypothetical protein
MPASPSTIRAPAIPPRPASSRARTRPSFANLKVHPRNLAGDDRMALLEARLTGTNTGPFILGETDRLVLGTQAETLPATGRGCGKSAARPTRGEPLAFSAVSCPSEPAWFAWT